MMAHRAMARWRPSILRAACMSTKSAPIKNSLYSYGEGYLGTLGHGNYSSVEAPKALDAFDGLDLVQASTGWSHTGVVDAHGKAYVFGRTHHFKNVIRAINMHRFAPWFLDFANKVGGHRSVEAFTPVEVTLPEKVVEVACGTTLSLFRTESGSLYANGGNYYGQCGVGHENASVWEAEVVKLPPVQQVAAGYQHVLALTTEGQVYSWGKGERGQLGYGTVNLSAPQQLVALRDKQVRYVDASFNTSLAVTVDGELYVWGKLMGADQHGRKNGEDQITPRLVRTSAPVVAAKSSHFHTLILTEDGRVWVLGRSQAVHLPGDKAVRTNPEVHVSPVAVDVAGVLDPKRIVRLGKGVQDSSILLGTQHTR
ncbi:hypothetical protein, variant 1 [Aphanomyces invadans]|uniref:RCC1-like domain-containing protein n=1 Tax=Aphanomyces invadans TaxID=157072 RepID=A0A024UKH1_9STRA|nr:hypothetical protein, variant 1 [Aphanomyces invadans]ETW06901.1 hypothetical protein, variant 1 [Aphanomyces invadans]|eukprot:XP_008864976.1 hypothetical protein, variant 1 [Aphanomyces invadans]